MQLVQVNDIRYGCKIKKFDRNAQRSLPSEIFYKPTEAEARTELSRYKMHKSLYYYEITLFKKVHSLEILEVISTRPDS